MARRRKPVEDLRDWRTITDEKEKYQAYLCSREWAEKREAVRKRSDGWCERCLVLSMSAVHHLSYARKYNESIEDLQSICKRCHEFIHGKSKFDPSHNQKWTAYLERMRDNRQQNPCCKSLRPVGLDVMHSPIDTVKLGETVRIVIDLASGLWLRDDLTEEESQRLKCALVIQHAFLDIEVVGWVFCGEPRVDKHLFDVSVPSMLGG